MAVVVTGGAGFVGLNIVEMLLQRGHDVVLLDAGQLPAGAERAFHQYRSTLLFERSSVLDGESVDAIFHKHSVERVIHAAAITSGPSREARDPSSIVEVNLRGTINVLEAARKYGVQRVVYIGSGAAYGESLYRLPRLYEETASVPTSLYSITKHAAERMCMRLRELWSIDVVCVRLGTVIGPWERDTGVRDNFGTHSQLAGLAVAGKPAILTEREIQRDWVYARDVAEALIALSASPTLRHTVYNVTCGESWRQPIAMWCQALQQAYPDFHYRSAADPAEANVWYTDRDRGLMDIGRLMQDTGFRTRYPMHEAYADYVDWIRRTPEFFDEVVK
ncbi:MAG: NAD-dependent epimerase/dehydratase family protein [Burkholderiales bacterium]